MTDETSTDGTELAEIVGDPERARNYWKRPLGEGRPKGPKVTVSADLFAELVAYAGHENWVIPSSTFSEARKILRSSGTGTESDGGESDD